MDDPYGLMTQSQNRTDFQNSMNSAWTNHATSVESGTWGGFINELSGTNAQNRFNAQEAYNNRMFQSAEAQKVRDWETYMSNTAIQRQVADMKAAGINPATASQTMGASTPGVGIPSGSQANSASRRTGALLGPLMQVAGAVMGKAVYGKILQGITSAKSAADAARTVTQETMRAERAVAVEQMKENFSRTYKDKKYHAFTPRDKDDPEPEYPYDPTIAKARWVD